MARLYNVRAQDFDRSLEAAELAMELAPNDAIARAAIGMWFSFAGKHDRAIEWTSMALRQEHNVSYSRYLNVNLAWALYFAGLYEEAHATIKGNEMVAPDEGRDRVPRRGVAWV